MRIKKVLFALFIVVIIAGIAGAVVTSRLGKLVDVAVSNVDLAKIEDGTYTGTYKVFPVAAEVKVSLKNHIITKIELVKHSNGQGAAAESIPGNVVTAQTLDVDLVSGATYSSKVILKAIENALISAAK